MTLAALLTLRAYRQNLHLFSVPLGTYSGLMP
jgi:hypothetical protein